MRQRRGIQRLAVLLLAFLSSGAMYAEVGSPTDVGAQPTTRANVELVSNNTVELVVAGNVELVAGKNVEPVAKTVELVETKVVGTPAAISPENGKQSVVLVTSDDKASPVQAPNSAANPDEKFRIGQTYEPAKLKLPLIPEGLKLPKSNLAGPGIQNSAKQTTPETVTTAPPKQTVPAEPKKLILIKPKSKDPSLEPYTGREVSVYRPIASVILDSAKGQAPSTDTVWANATVKVEPNAPDVPKPVPSVVYDPMNPTFSSDRDQYGIWWDSKFDLYSLPMTKLLWSVPLANPTEPKTFAKFTNAEDVSTIDTAIGGEIGIVRWAPSCQPNDGIQIDCFASVFSRFDELRRLNVADFRWGLPVTMRKGDWSFKAGYEHTSSHIGDENPKYIGRPRVTWAKDEIVGGISHRFYDMFRAYGQAGYALGASGIIDDKRSRFDAGLEWVPFDFTDYKGAPFAALDVQFREDQDFEANTTFQVGWMFKPNAEGGSGRIAFEAYRGKSPYGQLFRQSEDWLGITFTIDW